MAGLGEPGEITYKDTVTDDSGETVDRYLIPSTPAMIEYISKSPYVRDRLITQVRIHLGDRGSLLGGAPASDAQFGR